jgi:hypothetical protein
MLQNQEYPFKTIMVNRNLLLFSHVHSDLIDYTLPKTSVEICAR